jgi:hypothetical protein
MAPAQTVAANLSPNMLQQSELSHTSTAGQPAVSQARVQVPAAPIGQPSWPNPALLEATALAPRHASQPVVMQRDTPELETSAPEGSTTPDMATTRPGLATQMLRRDCATSAPSTPTGEAAVTFSERSAHSEPWVVPPRSLHTAARTVARPLQQERSTTSQVVVHIGNVHMEVRTATTSPPPALPAVQPRDAAPARAAHHVLHRLYLRGW